MGGSSSRALRADAVVVGSGAGGAPVAAILAEAGFEVVVLEAGRHWSHGDFTGREGEMTDRLMTLAATDGGLALYAGTCVGGSTVVNDALCWRPPPEILESWHRERGLEPFREDSFSPFVDEAWRDVHASPTGPEHRNRNAALLELGARQLGWSHQAIPRSVRGCANLGLCNFGCPTAAKQSALATYVPRAERAGARILDLTRALEVRFGNGRVTGVSAARRTTRDGEGDERIEIESPLVCAAAGVLGTPALLIRSGLPSDAIGGDVQFHSTLVVTGRFPESVHGYFGPTMGYGVDEFSDVNGRSGPGFMIENAAVHPAATVSGLPGFGPSIAEPMSCLPRLARALVVLRDRARGRARLDGSGRASFSYPADPDDLGRLRTGILALARLYLAAGAEEVYLPVNGTRPLRTETDVHGLRDLDLHPGRLALYYAVHLFGGAAMSSADDGAVDETGEVRGVRGLYVTDASGLPSNTGVNPQITILANASRIAHGIVARRRVAR